MAHSITAIFDATLDYRYHIRVTENQARDLINARPGDRVDLDGHGEHVLFGDADTMTHIKPGNGDHVRHEYLRRSSVERVLQALIADDAWNDPDLVNDL
jgi:hypothetical protein